MAKKSFKDRLLAAFRANDEDTINQLAEEVGNDTPSSEGQNIHIHLNSGQTAKDEKLDEETEGEGKRVEGEDEGDNSVEGRLYRIADGSQDRRL